MASCHSGSSFGHEPLLYFLAIIPPHCLKYAASNRSDTAALYCPYGQGRSAEPYWKSCSDANVLYTNGDIDEDNI